MSSEDTLSFQLHLLILARDLKLSNNKLSTFCDITQVRQWVKILNLRYKAPYSDYEIFSYTLKNHSSVTLFIICVYDTNFCLPTVLQS